MASLEPAARVRVACEMCRKRKRKTKTGYVTGLEDQIDLLKDELHRLEDLKSSSENAGQKSSPSSAQRNVDYGLERRKEVSGAPFEISLKKATPIQDISSLIWRMSIEDSGEQAFIGPSGNSCFPVSPRKPPRGHLHFANLTANTPDMSTINTQQVRDETQITDYLLELFIEFINPIHFFLTSSTIVEIRADNLEPKLSLVKYAVMAAASLLADDEDSRVFGNDAAVAVDSVLLPACRQYPSISLVQALAIMCWRELGLENHNMAWMYNSMCASMTVHLGLPVSSLHVLEDPQSEDNAKAKNSNSNRTSVATAWSAVMIDR
ncbi:hypothetical protein N7520_002148 [Penicillium odoratum]|uniref:uncharacterized protein n=1 Tax=Penicillium odoratum TaxID=1167516 RepID=UPI002547DD78|nr:uncharacterized protein N7520_002148 [Penicillium odoratum]KAJ5771619.1 hypothetical protein N7520_002148 [Penicillium odoratum]